MARDELATFDDDLLGAATEVDSDRLAAVARDHQQVVREFPGVDDIVYEWRNHLPQDPLVHRTPAVYVLALPDRVWAEFVDRLALDADEADALRSLHDRQARRVLDVTEPLDSHAAMVLTRP